MHLAVIVVAVVLAVVLTIAGIPMVFYTASAQRNGDHLGFGAPLGRLIGACALAGAAGLLVGLRWQPLLIVTAAAAIGLMIGALVYHRRAKDPLPQMVPALITAALALTLLGSSVGQSFQRAAGRSASLRRGLLEIDSDV